MNFHFLNVYIEMFLARKFQFIGTCTFLGAVFLKAVFLKAGVQEQIALGSEGHEIVRTRKGRNFDSYCTQPSKMIHCFLKRFHYLRVFVRNKETQS